MHIGMPTEPKELAKYYKEKFEKHLEWLRPKDHLTRATKGYESGLDYMMRRDNYKSISEFKSGMKKLILEFTALTSIFLIAYHLITTIILNIS